MPPRRNIYSPSTYYCQYPGSWRGLYQPKSELFQPVRPKVYMAYTPSPSPPSGAAVASKASAVPWVCVGGSRSSRRWPSLHPSARTRTDRIQRRTWTTIPCSGVILHSPTLATVSLGVYLFYVQDWPLPRQHQPSNAATGQMVMLSHDELLDLGQGRLHRLPN